MFERGLWAIVPGRSWSRWTAWTSSHDSSASAASRFPALESTAPSATWMWTPTPRSSVRPAAASSVSSLHVNAACTPTMPPPPARRKRSFSARPRRAPSAPWRSVTPYAHTTRTPTSRHAVRDHVERALDRRWRLVMVDDRSRSTLERLERAEHRRPLQHLEVERDVEPPPHLLEDLDERRRRARGRRHAASERRVQVMVRADETGRRRAHAGTHQRGVTRRCRRSRLGASATWSATRRRGRARRQPPRLRWARGRSHRRP